MKRIEIVDMLEKANKKLNEKSDGGETNADLILEKMIELAKDGDIKAAEFVRDVSGNKPKTDLNLKAEVTLQEALKNVVGDDEF